MTPKEMSLREIEEEVKRLEQFLKEITDDNDNSILEAVWDRLFDLDGEYNEREAKWYNHSKLST
jgi:hypothetical protein